MGVMSVRHHGASQDDGSGESRRESGGARTSMNRSEQIRIEIDELVLTGFSTSEGSAIAESVRETLSRLFEADVARWTGSNSIQVDVLDTGKIQVHRSGRAQSTGEGVARAIYGSLPT
jgi:hypothetical protein